MSKPSQTSGDQCWAIVCKFGMERFEPFSKFARLAAGYHPTEFDCRQIYREMEVQINEHDNEGYQENSSPGTIFAKSPDLHSERGKGSNERFKSGRGVRLPER